KRVFTSFNGYPPQLVDRVINRTVHQTKDPTTSAAPRADNPILVTLPFEGNTSYKLKRLLTNLGGVEVVFKRGKTLKNLLGATGTKPPTRQTTLDKKGTVYQIKCSCNNTYIGETGRPLNVRVKEHKQSCQKMDHKSAISEHLMENPTHSIDWENVTILKDNLTNTHKRKLHEAISITRSSPELNRDCGQEIPIAYSPLIGQ
ncbi:MAG: hypothetical protein MJA29_14510, partial [Candidatus Omnitrophica bacterium]|nr:hypothetical protein [Candidatus Omnitrophota bacterium]